MPASIPWDRLIDPLRNGLENPLQFRVEPMQVERDRIDAMVCWIVGIHVAPNVLGSIHHGLDPFELLANAPRHGEIGFLHTSRPSRRITSRSDSGHCPTRTKSTRNGAASP